MSARLQLIQQLRDHIIGELHVGHLKAGDRLPSIRDTARDLGKNARTVTAAYRALEKDGLVEVRGRSGVFVAAHQMVGEGASQEMARWVSGVLVEAWMRRTPVTDLPRLIRRATRSVTVRCGFVEVVEDSIVAFSHELMKDWGLEVRIIAPEELLEGDQKFADVDFFAATNFYAQSVHHVVARLGRPLVVLTVHARLQEAIRSRLEDRLTVIAVDRRFEDRMRVAYAGERHRNNIRILLAEDVVAIRNIDPDEPVLLTRAASAKLGQLRLRNVLPYSPTLSVETATALAKLIVQRNHSAVEKQPDAAEA